MSNMAPSLAPAGGDLQGALAALARAPLWVYKDEQLRIQGPFTSQQMLSWYAASQLPSGLPCCGVTADLAQTTPPSQVPHQLFQPIATLIQLAQLGAPYHPATPDMCRSFMQLPQNRTGAGHVSVRTNTSLITGADLIAAQLGTHTAPEPARQAVQAAMSVATPAIAPAPLVPAAVPPPSAAVAPIAAAAPPLVTHSQLQAQLLLLQQQRQAAAAIASAPAAVSTMPLAGLPTPLPGAPIPVQPLGLAPTAIAPRILPGPSIAAPQQMHAAGLATLHTLSSGAGYMPAAPPLLCWHAMQRAELRPRHYCLQMLGARGVGAHAACCACIPIPVHTRALHADAATTQLQSKYLQAQRAAMLTANISASAQSYQVLQHSSSLQHAQAPALLQAQLAARAALLPAAGQLPLPMLAAVAGALPGPLSSSALSAALRQPMSAAPAPPLASTASVPAQPGAHAPTTAAPPPLSSEARARAEADAVIAQLLAMSKACAATSGIQASSAGMARLVYRDACGAGPGSWSLTQALPAPEQPRVRHFLFPPTPASPTHVRAGFLCRGQPGSRRRRRSSSVPPESG